MFLQAVWQWRTCLCSVGQLGPRPIVSLLLSLTSFRFPTAWAVLGCILCCESMHVGPARRQDHAAWFASQAFPNRGSRVGGDAKQSQPSLFGTSCVKSRASVFFLFARLCLLSVQHSRIASYPIRIRARVGIASRRCSAT